MDRAALIKAEDARRIAGKLAMLKLARGRADLDLWEKYLPGFAQGRRGDWSTEQVLAAIDRAIAEQAS